MTSRGVLVDFVLATSGDKGARDVSKSRAKVARSREREQEGAAHETREVWCFAGEHPTLEVDVSDVLEAKIEARMAHASQTASPAALRRRWRYSARVERFHRVDLR